MLVEDYKEGFYMSKNIWKAKAFDYDALRFSFFIIMYSHIFSVVLCLIKITGSCFNSQHK